LEAVDDTFPAVCGQFTDFNYDINDDPDIQKREVMKINPAAAFGILKKFRFGSRLSKEETYPFPGFRRYKVQTVASWIEELLSETDRCRTEQPIVKPRCGTLKEQLGDSAQKIIAMARDPTKAKHKFFDYLDILVQWVNANPQVLNPEEVKNPEMGSKNWPKINNSFRTYDYVNPYRPAQIRLTNMSCGLERLKSSIVNELSGSNGASMISSIASVPVNIEMPLSRQAFVSSNPLGNISMFPMIGGGTGIYDTEYELQNLNNQYGYMLFDQIFKDLTDIGNDRMGSSKRVKLSDKSYQDIQAKLAKFKNLEVEIRKALANTIERNKLYQNSHGYINPYDVENGNQLKALLAKHSNLMNLSTAYNKKAINLIDLFQTITKAILGKIDNSSRNDIYQNDTSQSKYERPLTGNYHNTYQEKKKLDSISNQYYISLNEIIDKPKKTLIHNSSSIKFYDLGQPYYIFTNFYEGSPLNIAGVMFKTVEHYYQWSKFSDPIIKQRIVNAPTAKMAIDVANKNKYLMIKDHDNIRNDIMLNALRAKFSQYPYLGDELKSTGNKQLIEHYMYDHYWADGGDGSGDNMLGQLLMKVRQELTNSTLTYDKPFIG